MNVTLEKIRLTNYAINLRCLKGLLLDQITSSVQRGYDYGNLQHPRDNMSRHVENIPFDMSAQRRF